VLLVDDRKTYRQTKIVLSVKGEVLTTGLSLHTKSLVLRPSVKDRYEGGFGRILGKRSRNCRYLGGTIRKTSTEVKQCSGDCREGVKTEEPSS
jgi:hypothetical protein